MTTFFTAPRDWKPIAALRIFLGLLMMVETLQIWGSIDDLYGPYGFLEAELMNAVAGTSAPSFAGYFESLGWDYSRLLHSLFVCRWVILVCFTIGFAARTSTFLLWAFQSLILFSGSFSSYGVDRYFHLSLFLMLWMPVGYEWSIDAWRAKASRSPSPWATYALRVFQMVILITYINAGVAKAMGQEWWTGDAVWRALHMPEFRTGFKQVSFMWMGDIPLIPKVLGWTTLFLETFYFIGVWIPGIGILWTLAMIGMHLGIAAFMGLVNFGMTMALMNVALFLLPLERRSFQKLASLFRFFSDRAKQ